MRFMLVLKAVLTFALLAFAGPVMAGDALFANGWTLQADESALGFQSVKNDTKVEMNSIATYHGTISDKGMAEVNVALDSVDTHIDLRNVRMRFLFFETFKFPEAVITAQIDAAQLKDLPTKRRVIINIPFTLALHGVTKDMTADVAVTLITNDMIAVASIGVIPVAAADFGLSDGITKLQDAAKVKLVPVGSVSFDWIFARNGSTTAVLASTAPVTGAATAKEVHGDFDPAMCKDRFDTLSHAGNITFGSGSAKLDVAGSAVLDTLLDVVNRCPGLKVEVAGHTDNVGGDAANQTLSKRRATSVVGYLTAKGVVAGRLTAQGLGAAEPLVANDSDENRARNRRIEFKVVE